MSRLCRLKSYQSIGNDGKWAYQEITKLRKELKDLQSALHKNILLCEQDTTISRGTYFAQYLYEVVGHNSIVRSKHDCSRD